MYKALLSVLYIMIFIIFWNENEQSDNIVRITYSKNIDKQVDTTNADSAYKDAFAKFSNVLAENSIDLHYELKIIDFKSEFKENKVMISDDLNRTMRKLASSIGGTKGVFYINKKDSVYINQKSFAGEEFRVKINVGEWDITKEVKEIDGYTCFKATKTEAIDNNTADYKRNVVAWFCPSLPSFYGPASYFGLPGTVLEVSNGMVTLRATEISVNEKSKEDIKTPKKGELLTKKEYELLIRKIAKERFNFDLKN